MQENNSLSLDIQKSIDSKISESDNNKIKELSDSINLEDSLSIMSYGSAAQNKMVQFSENTLSTVMNKDLGDIGDTISDLIVELKGFDIEKESKGIFGFFKKGINNLSKLKTKYSKVEVNIDGIIKILENHQRTLLKDISILDQMYDYNLDYLKELNRFEKRLHDLELTKTVSIQTIPQIRMVQNNNVVMSEKIQSTLVNTIPLWKNQMVLAIGLYHSNEAAKAQRAVTDTTNELLRKNADMLKTSTIETARESERAIVDIETLKHTNEQLISTLDEVIKIQNEGREKRKNAEMELINIENELKNKILSIKE